MVARAHRLIRNLLLAGAFLLLAPALRASSGPTLSLPPAPELSDAGYQLILDFEVGGGKKYYDRFLVHPEWPGAASGVTIGVGYDLGYNSESVIRSDWEELGEPTTLRISHCAGITGSRAHAILPTVRDIRVEWGLAEGVFNKVTLARFYALAKRTYPGLDELRPNAQAAIVSLIFNRGSDLTGRRRREMLAIKSLVPRKDYEGIAAQLRSMKRIWANTDVGAGLIRRREAEAVLVLTP